MRSPASYTSTSCRRVAITCLHGSHCMTVMTRDPHVTLAHCSVGCNQLAECLDWGAQGLIAYGAHHQAVVYDPEVRRCKLAVRDTSSDLLLNTVMIECPLACRVPPSVPFSAVTLHASTACDGCPPQVEMCACQLVSLIILHLHLHSAPQLVMGRHCCRRRRSARHWICRCVAHHLAHPAG
jgi:hypothetical protein